MEENFLLTEGPKIDKAKTFINNASSKRELSLLKKIKQIEDIIEDIQTRKQNAKETSNLSSYKYYDRNEKFHRVRLKTAKAELAAVRLAKKATKNNRYEKNDKDFNKNSDDDE